MSTFELTIRYAEAPGPLSMGNAPWFWERVLGALRAFWEEHGSLIQFLLVCGLWGLVMFMAAERIA